MRSYWESRCAVLEALTFKAVPEGYIFQPAPSTIFQTTDAYVVTEAQRAQILAITRSPPPWWRVAMKAILTISAGIGICLCVIGAPLWEGALAAAWAWFLLHMASAAAASRSELRKLQPLLAGLPRSEERLWLRKSIRDDLNRSRK